jgi:hypothetical protein
MAAIGASYILTLYGEKINPEVEPPLFFRGREWYNGYNNESTFQGGAPR